MLHPRRAQMLAKNVGNNARNLAMHASKKWALTLIFVNERRKKKIIFDDGMDWKSCNLDA